MRRNPKIAFIGAGSTVFMKNIIGDVLYRPALKGATVALMDPNPERLAESAIVAGKLSATLGRERQNRNLCRPEEGAAGRGLSSSSPSRSAATSRQR